MKRFSPFFRIATAGSFASRTGTIVVLSASVLLAGCASVGGFVGAASGILAGTFTTNPAIGVGVGIAVQAATDTAFATIYRNMQRGEQDRIALLAGTLPVGQLQDWNIHHRIPFNDEHGQVQVAGEIDNALASCRMVMFSVIGGKKKAPTENWYETQICRNSEGQWKWAAVEPATGRWGNLQ